jgi:hypothetical protein
MKQRQREGICRVCGQYEKLTYEHVPPESAFNNESIVFQTLQDAVEGYSHSKFRQGIGFYSLCGQCNNKTGAWYGDEFVSWTRQGFERLDKLGENAGRFAFTYYIKPLNVIKQVATMALATLPETTATHYSELRQFVLDRERKYLPPNRRFYVYFNRKGHPRLASGAVVVNVKTNRGSVVQSEIALPPFGYALCSQMKNKKLIPDYWKLCDISWFAEFDYNLWTGVHLLIPYLETHYPFPMDYRTEEEIKAD